MFRLRFKSRNNAVPKLSILAFVGFVGIGCSKQAPLVFPTWSSPPAPVSLSSNSFNQVMSLGSQAADLAGNHLGDLKLSNRDAQALETKLQPIIASLQIELVKPCQFVFDPSHPLEPSRPLIGLALIGRVLNWEVTNSLTNQNGNQAIALYLLGTRLGFTLCGGDAEDAMIGDQIADSVRKALMNNILSLGAGQLETLSAGVKQLLLNRPSRAITVQNEVSNLWSIIESVQNSFLNGRAPDFSRIMGSGSQQVIGELSSLSNRPQNEQLNFFEKLGEQVKIEQAWLEGNANLPTLKRGASPTFKGSSKSPWIQLARYLLPESQYWLEIDDATLARTRLLAIYSQVESQMKSTNIVPKSVGAFPAGLNSDPYTGAPFFYVPSQGNFLLYSAGANGIDDGGATDSTFTTPDLFLENTR